MDDGQTLLKMTNDPKRYYVPCKELIGRMDEVDFSSYIDYDGETSFIEDEIDPDDIESLEE